MTNHWIDIRNADCVLIIGSNAAENHPICMKYVLQAQAKGAKVIHVDPRYSRTSARADMFIRIRTGTDIAFMGGMIYWILEDMRLHPENYNLQYVQQYTNAAYTSIRRQAARRRLDRTVSSVAGLMASTTQATWKYANPSDATADTQAA